MNVQSGRKKTIAKQSLNEFRKVVLREIAHTSILSAQSPIHRIRELQHIPSLREVEFKVFSQSHEELPAGWACPACAPFRTSASVASRNPLASSASQQG